jgi:hypothetical protein
MLFAAVREWRCVCRARYLFGVYAVTGGFWHRGARLISIVADASQGSVFAHCPACHTTWELYHDGTGITTRQAAGPWPRVGCACQLADTAGTAVAG